MYMFEICLSYDFIYIYFWHNIIIFKENLKCRCDREMVGQTHHLETYLGDIYKIKLVMNLKLLYRNNDLTLLNKLHGPMHYKIGVICVFKDTRYILCCNNKTV